MSTGALKFKEKFGTDPAVKFYVKNNKCIDAGIYSEREYVNSKNKKNIYWMLFPYVFNGVNYIWTEDKLTFSTFKQLTNFAKKLNFRLEKE